MSSPDAPPFASFRNPPQLTPHFRIASLAVLLSACLSPARDFSVDKKELGLEGVLWLELLLGVVVPGSGALLDESIDVDLTWDEW